MALDNTTLNAGSGGETFRSLADSSNINWPVGITGYATTISSGANVLSIVTPTNGLPVQFVSGSTVSATQGTSPWVVSLSSTTITGTVAVTQSGTWNLNNISGTISLPTGAATNSAVTGLQVTQGSTTSGQSGTLTMGAVTTSGPTYSTGQTSPLSLDTSGNLRVNVVAGSSGNAAASATGSAVPASADYVGVNVAGTLRGRTGVNPSGSVYAAQTDLTSIAGATVLTGHGTASGALRVELPTDGTGQVTANAGTNLNTSLLALESGGNLATLAGGVTASVYQENIKQINGITPLMGNGVTGTGSLRVTIASDNTAFTVNSVQSGTWNIGTVTALTSLSQWAGSAIDTNSGLKSAGTLRVVLATDQPTMSNAQPVTISAGSAVIGHVITDSGSTTAVTGSVTVAQATASSLNATVVGTGTFAVQAASTQSGTWTVQPGNTANTTPWLANESDPSATTGTISAADVGSSSNANSNGQTIITGSPTANSSVSCTLSAHSGVTIQLTGTSITSVTLTTERSIDGGTTWVAFSTELVSVGSSSTTYTITDNRALLLRGNAGEMTQVRVRCTAITGTSVAVKIQPGFGISQIIANQGPPNSNAYPWPVALTTQTSGGLTISSFISTNAVQSTAAKASPGQVYAVEFFNNSATPVYVRLYNQTSAPASTDGANIMWRGMVPGNTAGAGFVKTWDNGLIFSTGIGYRVTGSIADNDTTALTANTVIGNVEYK